MTVPAYPAYKDSGAEWLGTVPAHWRLDRIKASVESCRNGIWGDEPDGGDEDLVCVRVADFDRRGFGVDIEEPTIRKVRKSDAEGRLLRPGDLLIEKSGGGENQPVGAVVNFNHNVQAVCSNFVARLRLKDGEHPRFWAYLHAAAYAARVNMKSVKQTSGIQNLDQAAYFDERAAHPPRAEQAAIAAFLDRETGKIDALVEEQRRLISLLKEKRQAVISHAVTKGLNACAPLKPSGIEWLGDIPAHWEVSRVKWAVTSIEQGWSPQCDAEPVEGPDQWGVLKVGCVNGGAFRAAENKALPADLEPIPALGLRLGDVLVSRANTRELVGSAAVVPKDHPRLMLCDKLYRLRAAPDMVLPTFLAAFLQSQVAREIIELEATGASSSMVNIGQSVILEMPIALPPIGEQEGILKRMAGLGAQLDDLSSVAEAAVGLLQERRAALISAAVTGKIDVRRVLKDDEEDRHQDHHGEPVPVGART